MEIFPMTTFSATEMNLLAESFNNTTVRKYLHHLAYTSGAAIATGEPRENESAEAYLRRQARVQGQLDTVETLLSIKPAQAAQ